MDLTPEEADGLCLREDELAAFGIILLGAAVGLTLVAAGTVLSVIRAMRHFNQ